MNITFKTAEYEELYRNMAVRTKWSKAILRSYRQLVDLIIAAGDERDLRMFKGRRFEKLSYDRAGQFSMRIDDSFRLVFEIRPGQPKNTIHILEIVNYHKS